MKKILTAFTALILLCGPAQAVLTPARNISVDATTFSKNLHTTDTDVQTAIKSMDTLSVISKATSLETAPTVCNAGYFARGVDVRGNSLNCTALQTPITTGNLTVSGGLSVDGGTGSVIGSGSTVSIDGTHYLPLATDKTYWDAKQASIGFTPENVANKSTNTSLGTSDVSYPSQNAVKTYVDNHISAGALSNLTDVTLTSPTDAQVLTYESSSSKWKNKPASGGGSGTVTSVTGSTPIISSGGTTPIISISTTPSFTQVSATTINQNGTKVVSTAGVPLYITSGNITIDTTNLGSSVSGTLLKKTGNTLSVKEGTLTDTKYCTFSSSSGLVCNSNGGTTLTASLPLSISAGNLSLTQASSGADGYLSATDWNTFNGKQAAGSYLTEAPYDGNYYARMNGNWAVAPSGGTVTSVTGTTPITCTNSSTSPNCSMTAAGAASDGYLSSGDYQSFAAAAAGAWTVSGSDVYRPTGNAYLSTGAFFVNKATPYGTEKLSVNGDAYVNGNVTGLNLVANGGTMSWTGKSAMSSGTDGVITMTNAAVSDFSRLQLGGTSSGFPSLKRSGTTVAFRTADDSADTPITASNLTLSGTISGIQRLTVSGGMTTTNDVTIGGATNVYASANPDLFVLGNTEVDGSIYAGGTLVAANTGDSYISGNLSVGSSSTPKATLDVTGSVTTSGDIFDVAAKATTGNRLLCINSTGKIFSVSSATTCGAGT